MRAITTVLALAACSVVLAGCALSEDETLEGISLKGGNAIAHNSALQIIDPWPPGVQDTDLVVPADRGGSDAPTASADTPVQPAL